ncbi:Protein W02A2.5, partial [Aphelenchoides avenae]
MWTVFQLLRIVAKQNNLRVVPVVSPLPLGEHDVGRYENGTWKGMLGYVANGTVDTICLFYTDTPVRRQHFDFSTTVFKSTAAFAVGRRKGLEDNGLWGLLEPFSTSTWLCMLLSMLAVQITAVLISKAETAMRLRPPVASAE